MVLLDDLEVDVQYSKRPFEEQERSFLDNETTSPQDYEWLLLGLRSRKGRERYREYRRYRESP